jgi:hypothetical protein
LAYLILWTLLAFTVVGIPVIWIGFVVLKWLGIAGLFFAVGRRIGRAFGAEMSVLGGVLLCFGLYTLVLMAPAALGLLPGLFALALIKLLFWLLFAVPGVGLAILTLVGGRRERAAPAPAVPSVPGQPAPSGPTPDDTRPATG